MTTETVRYVIRFTGHVQGVGFRATTVSLARDLDVHGFVRNESDGSVLLDADGPSTALDELVSRLRSEMGDKIEHASIDRLSSQGRSGGLHVQG